MSEQVDKLMQEASELQTRLNELKQRIKALDHSKITLELELDFRNETLANEFLRKHIAGDKIFIRKSSDLYGSSSGHTGTLKSTSHKKGM